MIHNVKGLAKVYENSSGISLLPSLVSNSVNRGDDSSLSGESSPETMLYIYQDLSVLQVSYNLLIYCYFDDLRYDRQQ